MPDEKEIERLLSLLRDVNQPADLRRRALEQLLAQNAEVQAWLRQDFTPAIPETEAMQSEAGQAYNRLQLQIQATANENIRAQQAPVRIVRFRKWATIAAAVLAGIAATWLLAQTGKQSSGQPATTATVAQVPAAIAAHHPFDTISNQGSATSFHRLQDGSTVHLEPHSAIWFSHAFSAGKKEIFLKGAALFAVHKEVNRPFSVYANGIEVLDLGTVFSVTTHISEVKVRLIQGKVLIRPVNTQLPLQETALQPGEEFKIDTATQQYAVYKVSTQKRVQNSKLSSDLTFKNAPLQEVFDRLEKECNITIHYNNTEVKDKAFTGTLDAGSNARNIIAMICMVNDLSYDLKNNSIHIHK